MHSALPLFVSECSERLDRLETALLALERDGCEREALDAMFRDAHTIKGNASVVQSGDIEWFAHIVESVLERLRSGNLQADRQLISTLLPCVDHLRFLVSLATQPQAAASVLADEERTRLIGLLVPYLGDDIPQAHGIAALQASGNFWKISVSFAPSVFLQGLDPVYFLRHLQSIGRLIDLKTCLDALPRRQTYEPERCYLGFDIELDSVADKQGIEDIFALVRDACELRITPPQDKNRDFIRLIHSMPAEDLQVGEILVRVGALTADELAEGLRSQRYLVGQSESPLGQVLVEHGFVESTVIDAALQRQSEMRRTVSQEARQIKVSAERIEELEALLAHVHHGLGRLARECAAGPETWLARQIPALVAQTERAIEISQDIQRVRLGSVFHPLHRLIRDTSHGLGKQADLLVSGGELEVERCVANGLADPLIHLVRNAIDHGVEAPGERLATGKPTRGLIKIDAWQENEHLVLAIADDGAGIDRDRVRRAATERGMLSPDTPLEDADLLAILFSPGFTTAARVTRLSGRGVGLDAVRTQIRALGGDVSVQSFPARGTRFELRLPLKARAAHDAGESSRRHTHH